LLRHPTKGLWAPAQVGHHLEIDIGATFGYFYAPKFELDKVTQQAKQLIGRATRIESSLLVKDLQSPTAEAHNLFLGNLNSHILPPRATLHYRREVGRPRPANTTIASRLVVVETFA
jgi:hypothetical protein